MSATGKQPNAFYIRFVRCLWSSRLAQTAAVSRERCHDRSISRSDGVSPASMSALVLALSSYRQHGACVPPSETAPDTRSSQDISIYNAVTWPPTVHWPAPTANYVSHGLKTLKFRSTCVYRPAKNLDFSNKNVRLVIRTPFQKLRYYFCCINVLRLSNFYF